MSGTFESQGLLWPAPDQDLLITAATADGQVAEQAFLEWSSSVDLHDEFRPEVLRLLPLTYANLARIGITHPLMARLKGSYRRCWYDTHQLFQRVRGPIEALTDAGIDVMMAKGVPLVLTYYRNHAVRPMSDVDVCVPPARAWEAIDILRAQGWIPRRRPTPDVLRFQRALEFTAHGANIDLHWSPIGEALGVGQMEWPWEGAIPLDFQGLRVKQPSPAVMLLHLVVHGVRFNRETPVRWIPDSLAVLRSHGDTLDWERVLEGARLLRVSRRLGLGLSHIVGHHEANVPSSVLETLESTRRTLVERLEESVFLGDYERHAARLIGMSAIYITGLCRVMDPTRPLAMAAALPAYVVHRKGLRRRRQLVKALLRPVAQRTPGLRQLISSPR